MQFPLKAIVIFCILVFYLYNAIEGYITWIKVREWIFSYHNRDYLVSAFCILPAVLGHMATLWGHYFRSEREYQNSIQKATCAKSSKEKMSLWEHHIFWGYTVKYWVLVGAVVLIQLGWIVMVVLGTIKEELEDPEYSVLAIIGLQMGFIGGYNAIACCGIILFLVLRRSMLQALGFTYAEVLPLHRWLGALIFFWSCLHTVGYILYYYTVNRLAEEFNFYDIGRSTMNIMGCFALGALGVLAFFSIPYIRRRFYFWFITLHKWMTVIFFVGTVVHYPYYVLWYYFLPNVILYYVDRFVPKIIQARTLYPNASITLNADADIIKMTFTSPEPMKPYYPGDYILVRVPELGGLYHPFTIASYWAEDPCSITLFIRTYNENKASWTGAMARLCGTEDKRIRVKADVDGVFGDRRHDYLKSDVLVMFVAGAAITTFMALIKAVAAQIASSKEPLRIQMHLICTFRTRSELHAYGSFLHQITRDPRFTSWLYVEIYVSRPDKHRTLMGAHAHVIKNDIQVPGPSIKKEKKKRFQSIRRTGTMLKRALSGNTIVMKSFVNKEVSVVITTASIDPLSFSDVGKHVPSQSADIDIDIDLKSKRSREATRSFSSDTDSSTSFSPASPVTTMSNHDIITENEHSNLDNTASIPPTMPARASPTREMTYDSKRLPTFKDAGSAGLASKYARLDLHTTAIMIMLPLAVWFILRAIHWEGSARYCDVMEDMSQTEQKICYGTYATIPEFGHVLAMSAVSYVVMRLARRSLFRSLEASSLNDIESGRGSSSSSTSSHGVGKDKKNSSKSMSKNLPYPELDLEDEKLSVEDGNWDEGDVVFSRGRVNIKRVIEKFMANDVGTVGSKRGAVAVFGAGPEAFVEHCEKQIKNAKWVVDFHRETWAP